MGNLTDPWIRVGWNREYYRPKRIMMSALAGEEILRRRVWRITRYSFFLLSRYAASFLVVFLTMSRLPVCSGDSVMPST